MSYLKTLSLLAIACATVWSSIFMAGLATMVRGNLTEIGTFLNGIGTVGLLGAAVFGTIFLPARFEKKRLELAKREEHRKARFNVAQTTYVAFVNAVGAMQRIRSPFASIKLDEAEKYKGDKGSALHILERMNIEASIFQELDKLRPLFFAIFGEEESFIDFRNAWFDVQNAAQEIYSDAEIMDKTELRRFKYEIMWSGRKEDIITPVIDNAFARIKEICIPAIRQEAD